MTIHATKLHRPRPRASWIVRPRLLARLNRSLDDGQRLILISAPAGAGKTTLLGHWLAAAQAHAAWLSLDADDDEPARFWTCCLLAIQSVLPAVGGDTLAALTSPAPPPITSLLPDLLNEIGAHDERLILVLDDYHVLANRAIHDGVAALVDHLPEQMHLVICTRADPLLPLPRWRARGELTEVRAADLRFTPEEALVFLNERMDLDLQPADVQQLVERTEGWAAGLQLAALSLQGLPDPHSAIRAFAGSRHYMLDYLLEEVLARQPTGIQRFLLQTSILGRMCGPLCDAVTGVNGGAATLLDLLRQNLFVVPLDEERRWFRYHHLFAELLRARLGQVDPDLIGTLHLRASQWYEQEGAAVDAVQHALAAQAWDRAARLLEAHEQDWWTGSNMAVMNLLPHLPDEVVLRGPNLSVYKAWFLLIRGQLQGASALLDTAAAALAAAPSTAEYARPRRLRGHAAGLYRRDFGQSPAVYHRSCRAGRYSRAARWHAQQRRGDPRLRAVSPRRLRRGRTAAAGDDRTRPAHGRHQRHPDLSLAPGTHVDRRGAPARCRRSVPPLPRNGAGARQVALLCSRQSKHRAG